MKLILFYLILFSSLVWSQIESERQVTIEFDGLESDAAKPFLLHQAVSDAISQYSTELGIDNNLFKSKLDEKFNIYFENFKSRSLAGKFGKGYSTELSEEQKKTFFDGLESRREHEFIQFANFNQLLDSYTFKRIENVSGDLKSWKADIVLKLNNLKVLKFYNRITSSHQKQYSKLKILSDINLIGLNWTDLGLEFSRDFNGPLMTAWLKWVIANQADNIEEVIPCPESCDQFTQWQQLAQEEEMVIPGDLINSLWFKINLNLRKIAHSPINNEWKFSWDGSIVVLDVNTKKIISSYTLLPETKSFRNMDQKTLNSALASSFYNSSLDSFYKAMRKIQETPRLNHLSRLVITGHRHLGDVISLMDLLRKEGTATHFESQLDVFSQNSAELLCFYQGEEKSFTDLLSRVKEVKSSQSYRLVNEFTGVHHLLRLVAQ